MRWIIARNHFTAWPLASSCMCTASRVGRVCRCPLVLARLQRLLLLRSNQACNLLLGLLMKLTNLLALLLRRKPRIVTDGLNFRLRALLNLPALLHSRF